MNSSLRKNAKFPFIRSALAKKYDKVLLDRILTARKLTTPPSLTCAKEPPPANGRT